MKDFTAIKNLVPGTRNGKSILAVVVVHNDDTIISPRVRHGKEAFKVKRI